jgi:hypothetical protein
MERVEDTPRARYSRLVDAMAFHPEDVSRAAIDGKLEACGWVVQTRDEPAERLLSRLGERIEEPARPFRAKRRPRQLPMAAE